MRVNFKALKAHLPEIAILLVAIFLRVWLIEIKPAHFDEGINGWFADQMRATGYHKYDPTNYHGPLHFYAVFLSQTLFGRELWALRLPAILASILSILAILRFRDFLGQPTARFAALAMALSPAYVFYGRYSIHESWQVLFSILLLHAVLGLWQTGARKHLFLLAASITGMILTKETYVLHIGLVFFYSGTFLDFRAVSGLWETHAAWFKTGMEAGGHEKTAYDLVGPLNYYWLALMARCFEWPALLGVIAGLRFILPSDSRYRYVAIASAGTLLAYSIVSYKTPWCIISMLWPFYLLLGAVIQEAVSKTHRRALWWLVVPLLAGSLYYCVRLNFFVFTDDSEPYVYVQTYEDINGLTKPVLEVAKSDPAGYQMEGAIMLESYYPLPWIFGDFTRIGYFNKDHQPTLWNHDFIVIDSSQESEIEPKFSRAYLKIPFRLRSGQEPCTAYLAAEKFEQVVGRKPDIVPTP